MKVYNPTRGFRLYEHTISGYIDRGIAAFVRELSNHRDNVLTAVAVAGICGALMLAGRIEHETEMAYANERARAAEDRAVGIADWHSKRTVRVTLEGSPDAVATIAGQVANVLPLSMPVAK